MVVRPLARYLRFGSTERAQIEKSQCCLTIQGILVSLLTGFTPRHLDNVFVSNVPQDSAIPTDILRLFARLLFLLLYQKGKRDW